MRSISIAAIILGAINAALIVMATIVLALPCRIDLSHAFIMFLLASNSFIILLATDL